MSKKDETITDSLTGVLDSLKLDESDYKKHLEEKHLQGGNGLRYRNFRVAL